MNLHDSLALHVEPGRDDWWNPTHWPTVPEPLHRSVGTCETRLSLATFESFVALVSGRPDPHEVDTLGWGDPFVVGVDLARWPM